MHVAVGILKNANGEVLIAKRPEGKYKSGLWEFPGGKVEANETVFEALCRELKEEIGVFVANAESWLRISHDYGDRKVLLDVWRVTEFSGEPKGVENQEVRWVSTAILNRFQFPDGNRVILERLV